MHPNYRFYRKSYPDVDDTVMVKVVKKNDFGYTLILPEYLNMEALVTDSELARRKNYGKKIIRINDELPMIVIFVDEEKGHINVSKRRLPQEEADKFKANYRYMNNLNRLGIDIFMLYEKYCLNKSLSCLSLEDIMNDTIWRLHDRYADGINVTNSWQNIFNDVLINPVELFDNSVLPSEFKEKALTTLETRLVRKNVVSETEITLMITDKQGVYALRDILDYDHKDNNYKLTIVPTSPTYKIIIEGQSPVVISNILDDILETITTKSKKYMTKFEIIEKNKITRDKTVDIKFLSPYDIEKLTL